MNPMILIIETIRKTTLLLVSLFFLVLMSGAVSAGDALYLGIEPLDTLPASLESLLINSPTVVKVPAGAELSVSLMRSEQIVAVSRLKFTDAYDNQRLIPAVPFATFYPTGSANGAGQPVPGATLTPGYTDLNAIAAKPGDYSLMWTLTEGVIATPSRGIAVSAANPFNPLNLKLMAVSAAIRPGDQKPGSVLFYPRYTSSVSNPAREDSAIGISNTSPSDSVYVRVFMFSNTCQPVDYTLCLAPRQTLSLLASDIDPGTKGYIVAVACNAAGQPVQHNWLTGIVTVKQPGSTSGQSFDVTLGAIAVAKRTGGAVAPVNNSAEMAFDDTAYDRLPAMVAADNVQSQAGGGNNTTLILFRPVSDLAGVSPSATFRLTGFNTEGTTSSADVVANNACFRDIGLPTLRLSPTTIGSLIPVGTSAWFSITATDSQALLGAQVNQGRFSTATNARALSFAADYRIKMPVKALTCQ
ncbi:MAG: hypothetical protein ACKV2V_29700 [Blastocatellia bacterium]